MLRLVLLTAGAALLYMSSAQAHSVHAGCAPGPFHSGNGPHYHPGGYGSAVPCGGGRRGYYAPSYRGDSYYYGERRRRHHYESVPPMVGPYYRPGY